jgi:phage baseplate assembly protein V
MPSFADTFARRIVAPVMRQVRLLISRGVVELVNDSLKCQGLQVSLLADELRDNVERFEDYGMTSHPFTGSEVLYLSVGGNRSLGVAVRVLDRRYRPKSMGEGDVCLFTNNGERVYIESSGDIVNLGAKSAADFVALADDVKSELDAVKTDLDNLKTACASHTHPTAALGLPSVPGPPPADFSLFVPHTPGSVAATKVKAT